MYPENSRQLYQTLAEKAKTRSVFIETATRTFSYAELHGAVRELTALFRQRGLEAGQSIVIIGADDLQVSSLFLAALFEGLVPVVLSPDTRPPRVRSIISRVSPRLILVDEALGAEWRWLDEDDRALVLNQAGRRKGGVLSMLRRNTATIFGQLTDGLAPVDPRCLSQGEDMAYILFSSGTTSEPKGIVISHDALFEHLKTIARVFSYTQQSIIFNNLDIAHADGLIQGPVLTVFSGSRLYRPESFGIHNIESLLNKAYSRRITHMITVPTILSLMDRLLVASDCFDQEYFKTIVSVAGKLDANLWSRVQDRFGVRVCNIYGLTETVAGGLFCGPDNDNFRIGTVGRPVDVQAMIVSESGEACEPGQEGELLLKGDNVFRGYLDSPEADAESFVNGWLRTGDIAVRDADGFYSIVGRKKSVIISGGFNIHPDEVTEALLLHGDVAEAATVGIKDEEWGEIVMSGCVLSKEVPEDELIAHCRSMLERHKVPKRIMAFQELPRTRSGKVVIQELQDMLGQAVLEGEPESLPGINPEDILELAAGVFKTSVETLRPDAPPADVPGWDSLTHLHLVSTVEQRYSIQLSVHEMMSITSLGRLVSIVQEKSRTNAQ